MQLNKMFKEAPAIPISGLAIDSRRVEKNYIFFAIDGSNADGHDFIDKAIEKGASVIVHSKPIDFKLKRIVYISADSVTNVLNHCVKVFYNDPSKDMFVYALTGTNGKTTTAKLIKDLGAHFEKSGYIGTLGFEYNDVFISGQLTTPDAITLNYYINEMKKEGVSALALEVSSHGIALGRADSVHKDLVIFTNLTHDHLDFHLTFENYLETKLKLFSSHTKNALLNCDDPYYEDFKTASKHIITYGKNATDYRISNIQVEQNQTKFEIVYKEKTYPVVSNLLGEYNVYNLTAAIAALHIRGFDLNDIIEKVQYIENVPGRLTKIDSTSKINAFVDYAHTPDGLVKVFEYAKEITPVGNRIIAVFGSAGRRDVLKRPIFGEIADKYCDQIILTEDDPRDESIREIAQEIKKGIEKTPCVIIEDRSEALRLAVENAHDDDTIVALGKGSEQFMYRLEGREPWIGDDVCLKEYLDKKEKENELQ